MPSSGTLYIVSTPIGNLEDITARALRVLREVDLIAAEDTRHTRKLLSAYDIHTPLTSYFEHNEAQKSGYLVQQLVSGAAVALVSDAGTPGISDPGYRVITAAIAADIAVVPVPGPSAALAALTIAGLPIDQFVFLGFLTNKRQGRIKQLRAVAAETRTMVCYVSPHHLVNALRDLGATLGNRQIVVTRELTKSFEEVVRGSAGDVLNIFVQRAAIKGEFTLVIAGAADAGPAAMSAEDVDSALRDRMARQGMSRKDAVKSVAAEFGLTKNSVYQQSLRLRPRDDADGG
jgi:16S rRNA (cytidine1402-2'-O)-methyltransferase